MAYILGTLKSKGHIYIHDSEGYTKPQWDAVKQDLLLRYPGSSPVIKLHIEKSAIQLLSGQTIGRRGTPVISFWMMRDKWKNRGVSWVSIGTDGDVFEMGGNLIYPAVLQLAYFVTREGLVCQLAYEIEKETTIERTSKVTLPTTIEEGYNPQDNSEIVSDAVNDIYSAMAGLYE
jgi:hypothetical protein